MNFGSFPMAEKQQQEVWLKNTADASLRITVAGEAVGEYAPTSNLVKCGKGG